ncbi:hypothetical protein V5799_017735 [Amblyomma americanum]|uniref:Uncharacterized protein n=1 Tax=Amblyomma americanum TaxID=6943 RepID=A0AAQ4F199_AMBAM
MRKNVKPSRDVTRADSSTKEMRIFDSLNIKGIKNSLSALQIPFFLIEYSIQLFGSEESTAGDCFFVNVGSS